MTPRTTVVVLNWNGREHLETCLAALRKQRYRDFVTVLVDNGSTDGSREFVRERFPEVRLVALEENLGFSGGNNVVLRELETPYYALLNNDTEVAPGWLEALVSALDRRPEYGSAASRMMRFDDREVIDNCGDTVTVAGTTFVRGRGERMSGAYEQEEDVFGACAGAALYRTEMLRDVGLLDERFFMTYEDADLAFRAQRRGWRTIFVPGAVVYHKWRGTMRSLPSRQVFYSQRNIEWVWIKNMPTALIFRYAHLRLLYVVGSALFFARKRALGAFLKAKASAWGGIGWALRERKREQAASRLSSREIRARLSPSVLRSKVRKLVSGQDG